MSTSEDGRPATTLALHNRSTLGTTRRWLTGWLPIALLPFVARFVHADVRAPTGTTEPLLPYLGLALLCLLIAALTGAPPRTSASSDVLVNAIGTSMLVLGGAATSQVFWPLSLPRFVILLTAALVFAWLMLYGAISVVSLRRAGAARRVVAVVNPTDGDQLRTDVDDGPWEQHFALVDVITDEDDYPKVESIVRNGRATTLVLGTRASVHPDVLQTAEQLHREGVQVRGVDTFYEEYLGKVPLSSLDRFALMADIESVHGAYAPLKRAIDLACALVGGVVLLVVLPFVLIGNLIANRGPLWFHQDRVGLRGEPFRIWKFRTMAPGAVDVSGWTSNDDPRITPFGKLLRRTHIDELPQVLNIARGELAVVGPRPEQITYARQLEEALPFYGARHLVRPGLTGWAQVRYRYAASQEDAAVKLQYDLYYVRHESLATDLRIISLTFRHLVRDGGR
ncbi:MAG: sugar transferase [Ilumatobacter sp.]|nr:sugar transferase [Ilumatobacter sp.]